MTHSERVIYFDGKNTGYTGHFPQHISLGGKGPLMAIRFFVNYSTSQSCFLANFDLKSICLMWFFFPPLLFFWPALKSVDREVRLHKGPSECVLVFHLFELER